MFGGCRRLIGGAAIMAAIGGCSEQATDGGTVITELDPVVGLGAYSAGVDAVGLAWTASPSSRSEDMLDHRVIVRSVPGDSLLTDRSVPRDDTTCVVTGLSEGVTYRFDVVVRPTSTAENKGSSPPATVRWAPARRQPTQSGGTTIRVYESASGAFPSGLIIFRGPAPRATFLQNPSPLIDTLLTDLYLFTVNATTLIVRSAHLYPGRSFPRSVRFSSVVRDMNSLDDPAASPPDTLTYTASNTSIVVTGSTVAAGKIYFIRSGDSQYGRLLIVRQPGGTLIGGTTPDRFIELEVSYQTAPYQYYARRR